MSKTSKKSARVRRREEKKKHKLSNFVRFGPKTKGGNAKSTKKLKGERHPRGPEVHTAAYAMWCAKQKALAFKTLPTGR